MEASQVGRPPSPAPAQAAVGRGIRRQQGARPEHRQRLDAAAVVVGTTALGTGHAAAHFGTHSGMHGRPFL
jgi:hypothetical protein